MMAYGTTTLTKTLMNCPVCKKPITARIAVDLGPSPQSPDDEEPLVDTYVHVTPTGLSVEHDCIPRVTRSAGPFIETNDDSRP